MKIMDALLNEKESYAILGACYEVYKTLGNGFLEAVYQEALGLEFAARNIPFVEQKEIQIQYKNQPLTHTYKPDFVCFGNVIVEIKALSKLTSEHESQVLNYLKAGNYKVGLLINFGHYPNIEKKRFVN